MGMKKEGEKSEGRKWRTKGQGRERRVGYK